MTMGPPAGLDTAVLLSLTDDLVWTVDTQFRLTTFNRAFEESFAQMYAVSVAIGKSVQDLLPSGAAKIWTPLYERAWREGSLRTELVWWMDHTLEVSFKRIVTDGSATGLAVFARESAMPGSRVRAYAEAAFGISEIFDQNGSIMLMTVQGRILAANQAAAAYYGYSKERLVGMLYEELSRPLLRAEGNSQTAQPDEANCSFVRRRHRLATGEERDVEVYCSPLEISGKRVRFCIIHDVTERNRALMEVKSSEVRYSTIFQNSLDAVVITRLEDGKIVDVNQAFTKDWGYTREEAVGRSTLELRSWVDLRDREHFVQMLLQNTVVRDVEVQFRKKNNDTYWGLMSASVIDLDGVPCIVSVIRDVTEAREAENEIRNLAYYDSLTGLPNRRLLIDRLRQPAVDGAQSNAKRALIFVDLDNFKSLNDTLGHQMGDLILKEVARRLSGCLREQDTLARLGGDEFVLMLEALSECPDEAAAQTKQIAELVLSAIAEPYRLAGREFHSTASIGITVFSNHREATNEVLQQADIAMHLAKSAGGNGMRFFAPSLQIAVNAHAAMEQDMREAIKENQFQLYYQPQFDRQRLSGVEALLRWEHPRRGFLAPGEFIALAEETGLILPLGDWVLRAACEQIAVWAHATDKSALTIAVNISARQLRQPNFVETVLKALASTGAKAENLKLELTESMLVDNVEDVILKMNELKAHGVGFALDDFGTGYSSLSYLKRLPLTQLKIDQSFVRDILVDVSSCAIAQAIISLSRAMDLSVIAEGVETSEQKDLLNHLGCHSYQGYLYSRPLRLDDFEGFLEGSGAIEAAVAEAGGAASR